MLLGACETLYLWCKCSCVYSSLIINSLEPYYQLPRYSYCTTLHYTMHISPAISDEGRWPVFCVKGGLENYNKRWATSLCRGGGLYKGASTKDPPSTPLYIYKPL